MKKSLLIPPTARAFFVMDVLLGLAIGVGLLMMVTVSIVKTQHAQQKLAAARQSSRTVEDALLSLQAGQPLPPAVTLQKLPDPPNSQLPPHTAWVQLTLPATADAPAATLIGLVANSDQLSGGSAK